MHDRRRAHFTGIMTKSGLSPADTQANLPGKLLIRQRDHKKKTISLLYLISALYAFTFYKKVSKCMQRLHFQRLLCN